MQRASTRRDNSALRQGLIIGIILGVIGIVLNLISQFVGGSVILSVIQYVVAILLFVSVGILASRQTGKARTGAFAGFITGLTGSILSAVVTILIVLLFGDKIRQVRLSQVTSLQARQLVTNQVVIPALIIGFMVSIVLALVLWAGLGAIGGLIGRRQVTPPA
jgi:hypothetical protein